MNLATLTRPGPARRGYVTPLRKDLLGYTDLGAQILGVDKASHSATFVLATLIIDRDGEIVHPRGCLKRLNTYKRNPIVLYDHEGRPIGLSQTPAGACTVRIEGDDLVGTNYFQFPPGPTGKLARDVWECVSWEPPVLRMASVGFIPHDVRPIDSRVLRPDGKGGIRTKSGNEFIDWELTEWSITPLGANQQALRRDLKSLSVVVQKSFARSSERIVSMKTRFAKLAFSKRQAATAFKKSGGDPLLYKIGETPKHWTFTLKKAERTPEEQEAERKAAEEAAAGGGDDEAAKKKEEKPAEDGSQKPAAQVLKCLHNHHKGLSDYADETQHTQDHPAVLKMLMAHGEHAKSMMNECKDAAKEHYPDLDFDKFCKSEDTPVAEDPDDDDEDEDALEEFDDVPDEPEEGRDRDAEEEAAGRKNANGTVKKKYRMKSEHASVVKDAHEFLTDMGGNAAVPKSLQGACKFHAGELTKVLHGNGDTGREGHLEAPDEEDAAMEKAATAFDNGIKLFTKSA